MFHGRFDNKTKTLLAFIENLHSNLPIKGNRNPYKFKVGKWIITINLVWNKATAGKYFTLAEGFYLIFVAQA